MDIIICQTAHLDHINKTGTGWGNYMRYRDIKAYYKALNDVAEFMLTRPEINYRYLFVPSKSLGSARTEL